MALNVPWSNSGTVVNNNDGTFTITFTVKDSTGAVKLATMTMRLDGPLSAVANIIGRIAAQAFVTQLTPTDVANFNLSYTAQQMLELANS